MKRSILFISGAFAAIQLFAADVKAYSTELGDIFGDISVAGYSDPRESPMMRAEQSTARGRLGENYSQNVVTATPEQGNLFDDISLSEYSDPRERGLRAHSGARGRLGDIPSRITEITPDPEQGNLFNDLM